MKALVLREPGVAIIEEIAVPEVQPGEALLRVRRLGLCGSDLNTFRGRNSLVLVENSATRDCRFGISRRDDHCRRHRRHQVEDCA